MAALSTVSMKMARSSFFQKTLLVGNLPLKIAVEKALFKEHSSCRVELDPSLSKITSKAVYGPHLFCRDRQLTLLDGTVYIPAALQSNDGIFKQKFKSLLPQSSEHFLFSNESGFGHGFKLDHRQEVLDYVAQKKLPCFLGDLPLEGGNVILFEDEKETPKALVGSHSLILSMLHLDEKGFFTDERLAKFKGLKYSEKALKQARNYDLTVKFFIPLQEKIEQLENEKKKISASLWREKHAELEKEIARGCKEIGMDYVPDGFLESFRAKLATPLTAKEIETYHSSAEKLFAKLMLTKEIIAEQLRIPLKNIAFVAQRSFHIDEDLFVIPFLGSGGTVFVHDEECANVVLQNGDDPLFDYYLEDSQSRQNFFERLNQSNLKRFGKIGCDVIQIPGVFQSHDLPHINFMNSVVIDNVLLTNGCEFPELENSFKAVMQWALSSLKVHFIKLDSEGIERYILQHFLTYSKAGLNCLTWLYGKLSGARHFVPVKTLQKEVEKWEIDQLDDKIVSEIRSFLL